MLGESSPLDRGDDDLQRERAERSEVLADGRQRGQEVPRIGQVVEADDADVVRAR